MSEDGSVTRATILEVLRRNDCDVTLVSGQMFQVVKEDKLEVLAIPDPCRRKFVHYLARVFKVPIHHFYNPMLAPPLPNEPVQ